MIYTKRRVTSFVLTLTLAVTLFAAYPMEADAATPLITGKVIVNSTAGDFFVWELDPDTGLLTITGNPGVIGPSGLCTIPDYKSGEAPWYGNRSMVKEIALDRIGTVGSYSFADFGNLEKVRITYPVDPTTAASLERIGDFAFADCSKLTGIYYIGGVNHYGMTSLKKIGSSAFNGCQNLTELRIRNIEEIGANALLGCKSLSTIIVDPGNPHYALTDNILMQKNTGGDAIRIIKALTGFSAVDYIVPSTVEIIDAEAFMSCGTLESVLFQTGVDAIGSFAFFGCDKLKTAVFQGSAPASFGANVFAETHNDFTIIFYPGGTGFTAPVWNGYKSRVSDFHVTLDKQVIVIEKGSTAELRATIVPVAARQSVTSLITPGGIAVAEISSSRNSADGIIYVIKGNNTGSRTFTITVSDAVLGKTSTATCEISVIDKNVPATGIRLDKSQLTIDMGNPALTGYILNAVIYPDDVTNKNMIWTSSNASVAYPDPYPSLTFATLSANQSAIVPVKAGTANITVSTEDGKWSASCAVTVKGSATPEFVPVTNLTLSETAVAGGSTLALNKAATVYPSNATVNKPAAGPDISWEIIDDGGTGTGIAGDKLSAPVGKTGTVTIEATINEGLAAAGPPPDTGVAYTKQFTINVISYVPVTAITDVPDTAYVGVPLQLHGTVLPANASYKKIEWKLKDDDGVHFPYIDPATGAYIDTATGIMTAQKPGRVTVTATINNGLQNQDMTFTRTFNITIKSYAPNTLTLHANPGGKVSGQGQYADGEVVRIAATPDRGWVFAGWEATLGGGSLDDALSAVTQFTMPDKAATVVASFTYVGTSESGNDGWYYDEDDGQWYYDEDYNKYDDGAGVILPNVEFYFTSGSTYSSGSATPFSFVVMKDYQLLRSVSLNGKALVKNSHYTAVKEASSYTQITLVNGYLNTLAQGAHTLTVNFADNRTVTAVFSVVQTGNQSFSYNDVVSTAWYYDDVVFVSQRGWLTSGVADPISFRPNDPITQGDVVDALYRMAGSPNIMSTYGYPLQGRDASHRWVLNRSILPLDGPYSLDSTISRQNIAFLLSQFADVRRLHYRNTRSAIDFSDESLINPRALDAVTELYRAGIINGRTNDTFAPLGYMTRAEFAAVLHRFADSTRL